MSDQSQQRYTSCRGLLYYYRKSAGQDGSAPSSDSVQSAQTLLCLGLKGDAPKEASAPQQVAIIHAARNIPQEQQLDTLFVLGHSVYADGIVSKFDHAYTCCLQQLCRYNFCCFSYVPCLSFLLRSHRRLSQLLILSCCYAPSLPLVCRHCKQSQHRLFASMAQKSCNFPTQHQHQQQLQHFQRLPHFLPWTTRRRHSSISFHQPPRSSLGMFLYQVQS